MPLVTLCSPPVRTLRVDDLDAELARALRQPGRLFFPRCPSPAAGETDDAGRTRLRILDLGIGPGISGIGILDRRPQALVIGLDFSRTMLRLAQRYLRRAGLSQEQLPLIHGDVLHLPFP